MTAKSEREFSSSTANHYTPSWLVEAARKTMGGIDLDPCSCARAQKTVKAKQYLNSRQNGLTTSWFGARRVFINPPGDPRGRLVSLFWGKLWIEVTEEKSQLEQFVWVGFNISHLRSLQPAAAHCAVCVPKSRIKFTGPSPDRDNTILYWGEHVDRFTRVFEEHGAVWVPA